MKNKRLPIYLRTHRLQWGLSQPDLGQLLGVSKDTISKYELGKRTPAASVVLSIQIIFGATARNQFPALHRVLENELIERLILLEQRLRGKRDARSNKKLELLEGISRRLYELDSKTSGL
jgi:transcriptional regulator with XRE-family HTH domain